MKITKISYSLACTINLGNYENMRPEITIEAEADLFQSLESQFDQIEDTAKRELALSLWNRAQHEIADLPFLIIDEERRLKRARNNSTAFRWMSNLSPAVAADLLADVVQGQQLELARQEAQVAAEMAEMALAESQSVDTAEADAPLFPIDADSSGNGGLDDGPEAEPGDGEADEDLDDGYDSDDEDDLDDEETADADDPDLEDEPEDDAIDDKLDEDEEPVAVIEEEVPNSGLN